MNVLVNIMHQAHPMASIFRPMDDKNLKLLCDDIRENGQREAIVLAGDLILDGRSREKACQMAGLVPARYIQWEGTEREMLEYVIFKNLNRPDLKFESKALAAARCVNVGVGYFVERWKPPAGSLTSFAFTATDASQLFGVKRSSIQKAKQVLLLGSPKLIDDLDHSRIAITAAYRVVPKSDHGKLKPARETTTVETIRRDRSNVYGHLKTAIDELMSLPKAQEVAGIAKALDRSGLTTKKLPVALAWLQEFAACLSSES